jgi:hypothetical protein
MLAVVSRNLKYPDVVSNSNQEGLMAATKSQGRGFTLFIVGLTVAAAGIAYFSTGSGKLALIGGLVVVAVSFAMLFKIKPLEGPIADRGQPAAMKLAGLAAVIAGWLVVLFGLHLTDSVSGRMIATLVGISVSLVGSLVLLPAASNKNAIWKG